MILSPGIGISKTTKLHEYQTKALAKQKVASTSSVDQILRVTRVALPFLSLYKPLGQPLSLIAGGARSIASIAQLADAIAKGNSEEINATMLQTAISTGAFVCTIFAHPLGMLITTGNDLAVNFRELLNAAEKKEYRKVAEISASALNNVLYLGIFFTGAFEFTIAAYSVQVLLGLYHSSGEFKKGNYLEAGGHLLMAGIRTHQLHSQIGALRMKWESDGLFKKIKAFQSGSTARSTAKIATGGLAVVHNQKTQLRSSLNPGSKTSTVSAKNVNAAGYELAYKTELVKYQGCDLHIGYYANNTNIISVVNGNGVYITGSQFVYMNNTLIGTSANFSSVVLNGIIYYQHKYQGGVSVYTNAVDGTQFVVW